MDITEFFQQSAGKWLSQRTSHHLASKKSESGKSEIQIEFLPTDHAQVIQLCEQRAIAPSEALCGVHITWDGTIGSAKQRGSAVMVAIANPDNPNQGALLHSQTRSTGCYLLGNDGALTLTTESDAGVAEERLWYAHPNLRFRSNVLQQSGQFSMASFVSEIRVIPRDTP